MDRSRASRILEEWSAVANQVRRPAAPPRPVVVRGGLSGGTLAGASLAAIVIAVAVLWLGGRGPNGLVGGPSTPPSPSATSTAPATPSPVPTIGPCDPAKLAARITMWEGAAGHRIAHLELRNAASAPCAVRAMAKPQLVDGRGAVLIDGSAPPTSGLLTVAPGGVLTTLVQDGNYCGPAPLAPVSVAFVLRDGGTVVANPLTPTDATLPPCNGAPGSAGTIEMQPWAP